MRLKLFLIFFLFFFITLGFSQSLTYKITGKIIAIENEPIVNAVILIDNGKQKSETDQLGFFTLNLDKGEHTLYIEAPSYARKIISIEAIEDKNIGNIILTRNVVELNEVVIKKKKSDSQKIEPGKKTYILANDPTMKGNNLTEVLQNVPSVNVDAEGNVSVRGNENATVLIDGKPSSMTGISSLAEALKSIPADMVEKIEVVTNPSSKYDASGSGGVVNIILKKDKISGFLGSIETYIGNQANAGMNVNLSYKKARWNYFTILSYQHFEPTGKTNIDNRYLSNGIIDSQQVQATKRLRVSDTYTLRLGSDFTPNAKNTFSISGILKTVNLNSIIDNFYNTYQNEALISEIERRQDSYEKNFILEGNFGYKKIFESEKHQFNSEASIAYSTEMADNTIYEQQLYPINQPNSLSFNPRSQIQRRFLLQADYIKPVKENGRMEMGYRGTYKSISNEIRTDVLDINDQSISNDSFFTNTTQYTENVQAFYIQFGNNYKKIAYQMGLRTELSIIDLSAITIPNKNFTYLGLFPSASLNYKINEKTDFQFSYSRRIDRPNIRFLSPVYSAADNKNAFVGNLLLQPSYTNMFEVEFIKNYKTINFSSAVYFSNSLSSFNIIRTIDTTNNLFIATPVNIDYLNRFGVEFNVKYSAIKWWKMNGNLNFYQYDQKGTYNNINLDGNGLSWFGRYSSNFILPYKFNLSMAANYHGPNKTNNANTKGIFSLNMGLSRDLLKNKATLTLSVNDVFNGFKRRFTNFGDNYISDVELQFRQRQINLSFIYRFNGAKKEQLKKSTIEEEANSGGGF